MRSGGLRVVLFLLVVLAFGAAAYEISVVERQAAALREHGRAFEDGARRAEATIAEVRSAQVAYVAPGQGAGFWTARTATLLQTLSTDLSALRQAATSTEARADATSAIETLGSVEQMDRNIQGYVREEQRLLASDLIFSDLREAVARLAAAVDRTRLDERAAVEGRLVVSRRTQTATAGGAAAFAVLVLMLLLPAGTSRSADQPARRRAATAAGSDRLHLSGPADDLALDLRPAAAGAQASAPPPGAPAAEDAPDLRATAELCTDLARLRDSAELGALLGRAAVLLDAAGVIVWIDDAASGELRPALSHGYPPQSLTRIRGISKGADNATASAYRDGKLRVVEGDGGNGAIAVPLLTASGCAGVMAAELRAGGEHLETTRCLATIVAAQLATLVTPTSS